MKGGLRLSFLIVLPPELSFALPQTVQAEPLRYSHAETSKLARGKKSVCFYEKCVVQSYQLKHLMSARVINEAAKCILIRSAWISVSINV